MTERGIAEIIAVEDARIELGNVFRRVLEIVVHDDDDSTAGVPQSGHDGIVLAAVAPQIASRLRGGGCRGGTPTQR